MCSKWVPWKCLVFRRGIFSVFGSCEVQKQHHSLKCTVWVAISKYGILEGLWFEYDNEHCVTIITDRYVLRKFLTELGRRKDFVRVRQWFQRNGAEHASKESMVGFKCACSTDELISITFFELLQIGDFYITYLIFFETQHVTYVSEILYQNN